MSNALIIENLPTTLIIQFNCPEIRSPLSIFILEDLHKILDATTKTNIIFTGSENVFASGADLREIAKVTGETAREFALRGQTLMNKIAQKNSVAVINGFCFGGALDLALACRQRYASPNAQFSHPGANLGIMTGWGGTQRLPRLIGQAAALEIFLTGKRISAEEALKINLIDSISGNPLKTAFDFLG